MIVAASLLTGVEQSSHASLVSRASHLHLICSGRGGRPGRCSGQRAPRAAAHAPQRRQAQVVVGALILSSSQTLTKNLIEYNNPRGKPKNQLKLEYTLRLVNLTRKLLRMMGSAAGAGRTASWPKQARRPGRRSGSRRAHRAACRTRRRRRSSPGPLMQQRATSSSRQLPGSCAPALAPRYSPAGPACPSAGTPPCGWAQRCCPGPRLARQRLRAAPMATAA